MEYNNLIYELINHFPEIKDPYEEDRSYFKDVPHVTYSFLFVPYIIDACKNNDVPKIINIRDFLEEMAESEDYLVNNLLGVSIIESLLYKPETLILMEFLKEKALYEFTSMARSAGIKGY